MSNASKYNGYLEHEFDFELFPARHDGGMVNCFTDRIDNARCKQNWTPEMIDDLLSYSRAIENDDQFAEARDFLNAIYVELDDEDRKAVGEEAKNRISWSDETGYRRELRDLAARFAE